MRWLVRVGIALVALVAVVAAASAGIWFYAAKSAEAQVREWAQAQRAHGYQVTISDMTTTGFPRTVTMALRGVAIAKADDIVPWSWSADGIVANRAVFGSPSLLVMVLGNQTLTYRTDGADQTTRIQARRFSLDVRPASEKTPAQMAIDVSGLTLARPGDLPPITAKVATIRVTRADGEAVVPEGTRVTIRLDTLVIPENRRGPLGDTIDVFNTDFTVQRPIETLALPAALDRWRQSKGYLNVRQSEIRWGTLNMTFSGAIGVDDHYRPSGYLNSTLKDFGQTIDAFFAAGRIDAKARADISTMLNFIQGRGVGVGGLGLPMDLAEGNVTVGALTLGTLPALLPFTAP